MGKGIIYCYKDIKRNKVVYVGQTINLKARHDHHLKYDPFNELLLEYHYPLSRAIRKYGADNYELIILEQGVQQESLNELEVNYIAKFNTYSDGYNQTIGGQLGKYSLYSDEIIDTVIELLQQNTPFEQIELETGVSSPHISNINQGERCVRDGLNYPIRGKYQLGVQGRKLTMQDVKEISTLLKNTRLFQREIAEYYNVTQTTISDINRGRLSKRDSINYPIRQ